MFLWENYKNSWYGVYKSHILKFSLDTGFSGLSVEWFRKYKLDFNFIDPKDKKTVLDFLAEQEKLIRNSPPVNTDKADEYQRLYKMFRNGGAKHNWELNQQKDEKTIFTFNDNWIAEFLFRAG